MTKGFSHEDRHNKNIDWYTPSWIFERLGLVFDLDPCQPETPISWIPALKTFHLKEDGLSQPWHGLIWCNPPYGRHIPAWLNRMHNHRNGVALVFARTDCAWFHDYVAESDAILFLRKRIKFVDALGVTSGTGAGSGSMLVAWGDVAVAALERVSDLGYLLFTHQSTEKRRPCPAQQGMVFA